MSRVHFRSVRRQLPAFIELEEDVRKNVEVTDDEGIIWYLSEVAFLGLGGEYQTYLAEGPVGEVVEVPETDLIRAVMDLRRGRFRDVTRSMLLEWSGSVGRVARLYMSVG